jgi:ATP/maltotriose-dependent transcriptional regulator MalT
VRLARAAVALRLPDSPEAPSDSYFLGVCLYWTGVTQEAEARLRGYLDEVPPGEMDVRRVYAMALLAVAHAGRGEYEEAQRLVDTARATIEARGQTEHPPSELVYVALGILLLARDDVEAAEDELEHAATLARRGADKVEIAHAMLWLGRSRVRAGDAAGAADALDAARAALDGAIVPLLSPVVEALEREIREAPEGPATAPDAGSDGFSAAEQQVLDLLPSGLTYREIAGRLELPLPHVRSHSRRIRHRLGATTRGEAVTAARRLDLL